MRILRYFSALFGAMLLSASLAQSQSVGDHLGPIPGKTGQNGPWNASLTGGWFLLTNQQEAGSLRYFSTTGPKLTSGTRTLKANVIVLPEAGANAYGGLLFDFVGDTGYFAFTIAGDGRVILWDRTNDGFKDLVAENVRAKLDGSDILEVRETPTRTTFHINGAEVFHSDNANGFSPTYGIIAIGQGRFGFDGYTVDLQQGGGQLPQPGGNEGQVQLPQPGGNTGQQGGGQPGASPLAGATAEELYRAKVILGSTLGIFFHEFGHAIIGETKLPATGPEEDVADGFSAFVLSSTITEGEMQGEIKEFFTDVVKYSALLWYYQAKSMEAQGQTAPWQGEHAPDIKRFRNSFCIIYGSDPQRYEQLANQVQFGDRAKQRCQYDYKKRYDAWETILKTVARDLGPDSPGNYPADHPGGNLNLTFVESTDPYGDAVEALLRDTGTMAEVVKGLEQMFVWPRDLSVQFRDCEVVNAWYDPQKGEVVMCYSLIKMISEVVFAFEGQGAQVPVSQTPGGQPGGQLDQGGQFLVGLWGTQMQGQSGPEQVLAQIAADGSYQLQRSAGGYVYSEQGSWQAQLQGQSQIQLAQQPKSAQICDPNKNCQPQQVQASTIIVKVMDQNRISTEGIVWQRQQQ